MPTLFLIIPFIGIVILNLFYSEKFKRYAFGITALITIIQVCLAISMILQILQNFLLKIEVNYFVNLSIDIYGAIVLFTIGLISFVSLVINKYSNNEYIFNFSQLLLIIMIGMNGTIMVTDIFSLYVFLEVTSIASFILIAKSKKINALNSSFKYLLMSSIAALLILTGIGILFLTFGTLSYEALALNLGNATVIPTQLIISFVILVTGFSIKAGLVPFHMWVPDAYSEASRSVSVLLAGIVTKAGGIYAILRLVQVVFIKIGIIQDVFAFLAIISIIIGALLAIGQTDFNRMLAYSSISQVGYIIIGACCATPLGFLGAFLHFFNHATFKSLLFVNSAAIKTQTGIQDLNKLRGLASKMKITAGTSAVAFLSASGIPPLAGFWSKIIIIIALWQAGYIPYAIIALLASILTLAYFLILQRKVFFCKPSEEFENVKEANIGFTSSSILLAMIIILVGVGFPFVLSFLKLRGLI